MRLYPFGRSCYAIGMKRWILGCLLVAGCADTPQSAAVHKQFREMTKQQRETFESPGDSVTLAATPDTGIFGSGDPTHDCSTCVAR